MRFILFSKLQMKMCWSRPPETMYLPLGDHARLLIRALWNTHPDILICAQEKCKCRETDREGMVSEFEILRIDALGERKVSATSKTAIPHWPALQCNLSRPTKRIVACAQVHTSAPSKMYGSRHLSQCARIRECYSLQTCADT